MLSSPLESGCHCCSSAGREGHVVVEQFGHAKED